MFPGELNESLIIGIRRKEANWFVDEMLQTKTETIIFVLQLVVLLAPDVAQCT